MALNTEEKKSEPPSPHAHLSAEELYQSFLTTPSDRYRYDLAVEVAHRSQTDKAIVRRYVPLFDNSTYRSAVVYLLKHIEVDPSLIPDLETILDQLLLLEPARGSNGSESLRMGVYTVLGKYNAYAQAVLPILLNALQREEWINNVLDELVLAIVNMGPAAIPSLKALVAKVVSKPSPPPYAGVGSNVLRGAPRALLALGVSEEAINQLIHLQKKKRRWW